MDSTQEAVTSAKNSKNENRKLIRKLDLHILPILSSVYFHIINLNWILIFSISIIYLLSYLDRSNIANAKLAGLERDTHLTPTQYRWYIYDHVSVDLIIVL